VDDDPMELDELILHVHKLADVTEDKLSRELSNRFLERTEIRLIASCSTMSRKYGTCLALVCN
jgi:hypothetical protein